MMVDKGPRVRLWANIEPAALEGWTAAAKFLGVPRTQLINMAGRALHQSTVTLVTDEELLQTDEGNDQEESNEPITF